ncbi:hypothetical protein [Rhodococcus erythropolis]|uniref:Uncharacterized protein n=1 Tax=Rhodococcus erythropolis TaxID=1833 RepID=A0A8I0ZTH8_RHOER|nr:hypothetical protein [Rhodococcus erythropolis]MBH5141988.1 hypothetical protein [Rhodococcus erythropolis]MBH5145356.1 hypothetical protein [Rhodococcus erythropolis]MBH5145404.1 hypothetical protein [Rhodococcus erythropolis]
MSKDFYTASELADLGYVSERLTSVFGEPDSVDGEFRWDADTVVAVERDVLAPAARIMFDAFAPEWNTRVQMNGSNLALGWPQLEQMLARVTMRES